VRLPRRYRIGTKVVQAQLVDDQLVIRPVSLDLDALFEEIDSYGADFPPREEQPPMQERDFSAFEK
jgi:virulence-associated protein VagC